MESVNPYTKTLLRKYEEYSSDNVNHRLALAQKSFASARNLTNEQKRILFNKTADLLKDRRESLAQLAVSEMGKTITAARAEVAKCELTTRYFADHIEEINRSIEIKNEKEKQFIKVLPIGCVLAVMPWNFPYWQAFRAALAALSVGNTMILKHASNVSGCALAIEKIFADAGWESGIFQTLLISSKKVKDVIVDPRIAAVTLTGSERAGKSVAEYAGKVLKKLVLELGGSDAFVVTSNADIKAAAIAAAKSRTINNGQSCVAAKRFIVQKEVAREFLDTFISEMKKMKIGDPSKEDTEIGPLVTDSAYQGLKEQYARALEEGAKALLSPTLDDSKNLFGPAVLQVPLEKVNKGVFAEEFFGPVALYYEVTSLDEALSVANNSNFGLGSNLWSNSNSEIDRAINEMEAGMTFINSMVASAPQLPFGGVKSSGYGRELGFLGPHEFANLKSVSIALGN